MLPGNVETHCKLLYKDEVSHKKGGAFPIPGVPRESDSQKAGALGMVPEVSRESDSQKAGVFGMIPKT